MPVPFVRCSSHFPRVFDIRWLYIWKAVQLYTRTPLALSGCPSDATWIATLTRPLAHSLSLHPLTLYSIFLHKLFIAIISSQCLFSLPAHLFLSTSAFRCLEIIFLIYYYFLSLWCRLWAPASPATYLTPPLLYPSILNNSPLSILVNCIVYLYSLPCGVLLVCCCFSLRNILTYYLYLCFIVYTADHFINSTIVVVGQPSPCIDPSDLAFCALSVSHLGLSCLFQCQTAANDCSLNLVWLNLGPFAITLCLYMYLLMS